MSTIFSEPEAETAAELDQTSRVLLPRVNLLPPEVAEAQRFRRIQMGLAGVVCLAVAAVGVAYSQADGGLSEANDRSAAAAVQHTRLQRQIASYANVEQTKQQYDATRAALSKVLGQDVRWSRYLHDLSITLPANVWLTSVALTQSSATPGSSSTSTSTSTSTRSSSTTSAGTIGQLTISGQALSYNDVAVWLETLAKEHGYVNVYLTSGQKSLINGQTVIAFTSTASMSDAVLSHRYNTQAGN